MWSIAAAIFGAFHIRAIKERIEQREQEEAQRKKEESERFERSFMAAMPRTIKFYHRDTKSMPKTDAIPRRDFYTSEYAAKQMAQRQTRQSVSEPAPATQNNDALLTALYLSALTSHDTPSHTPAEVSGHGGIFDGGGSSGDWSSSSSSSPDSSCSSSDYSMPDSSSCSSSDF